MKSFRIEAPSIQNWSCHGCSACCRGALFIELTEAERKRIEGQGWTVAEGVDPVKMIVAEGDVFRLGHQSDGACVFLDEAGRCRIHSRFGEAAKPRACRLYPLTLHPAGKKLVVGLRFSCPSAASNSGQPLAAQIPLLGEIAPLVVPEGFTELPAPAVLDEAGLEWRDFMRYVNILDKMISAEGQTMALKLRRALHWLDAVEKSSFDSVTGGEGEEILRALAQNAAAEVPVSAEVPAPTKFGGVLFRGVVAGYARRGSMGDAQENRRQRRKLLGAMLRFAWGNGRVPALMPELGAVEFAEVEKPFGVLPAEAEATLTRFFRMKIQSLHFCGAAYYGMPLVEGFRHLALLFPVILWLARWHAASEKRDTVSNKDVERAMVQADYHHGYSPGLATGWARRRVRLLAQRDDIARLCAAYGGTEE